MESAGNTAGQALADSTDKLGKAVSKSTDAAGQALAQSINTAAVETGKGLLAVERGLFGVANGLFGVERGMIIGASILGGAWLIGKLLDWLQRAPS